jgi:hypothetical protein
MSATQYPKAIAAVRELADATPNPCEGSRGLEQQRHRANDPAGSWPECRLHHPTQPNRRDAAMQHTLDIECELDQYVRTALWSTNADHLDPEGTGHAGALEDHYDASDIAPESLASMRAELVEFLDSVDASFLEFWQAELGAGQVGHDFWLTRNGHGAGFWDRFSAGIGSRIGQHLTEASRPFGESYLYAADDGKVYVS